MTPSLTVVVAVYNAARYLELVLCALRRQSMPDFEVVVADDGSGPEIAELLRTAGEGLLLRHCWQPDEGFRKNRMLNEAVARSATPYLLFIDGDCVPHRHFVRDHWLHRRENAFLCGRRVNLSEPMTRTVTPATIASGAFERWSAALLFDGLMARSSNLEDAIRIESGALRLLLHRNKARILGCNFSVSKSWLERINGFNEEYRGPGIGEDTDIAFRLGLAGARAVTLRYLAVLYHLYHPATRVAEANRALYARVVAAREAVCAQGLRGHLLEGVAR